MGGANLSPGGDTGLGELVSVLPSDFDRAAAEVVQETLIAA